MNLQPTLNGQNVLLRPLEQRDFAALFQCASDPLIWEQHPQSNRYQRPVFETFFAGAIESGGAFAVLDRKTEKIIGSSRFYEYTPTERRITIGYTFLERRYWGGDFNRDMKKTMTDYAFEFVDEILFEIGAANFRSRRAIEKIGAVLIKSAELDEKPHVIYSLRKARPL